MERSNTLSISLPSYNNGPISRLWEWAKLAEDANFDVVWTYEMLHNPALLLAMIAPHTSRIKLGTGIIQAFTRSPVAAATLAADVDELSNGRMILGMAPGADHFLRTWHSTDLKDVIQRMREYIEVVRTTWHCVNNAEQGAYNGKHYSVEFTKDDRYGVFEREMFRSDIPIYLGGTKPRMLQLAGEFAQGQHGYMYTPKYLEEVVYPNLEIGAKHSGRRVEDVDICLWIICGVHEDREEAWRRARIHTGTHALGSEHLCRFNGLDKEWEALSEDYRVRGFAALEDTPDKIVETFSIAGTPAECREQLAHWQKYVPHICLDTPYVHPLTPSEADDCCRRIIHAFAR